jgi:hypothetical protein
MGISKILLAFQMHWRFNANIENPLSFSNALEINHFKRTLKIQIAGVISLIKYQSYILADNNVSICCSNDKKLNKQLTKLRESDVAVFLRFDCGFNSTT